MNLFARAGGKEKLMAVFDVGSASVGAALFYILHDGKALLTASIREPIILEEGISGERFLYLAAKSLESVAKKVSALGAPERVFVVLSSPWYSSQTRIIKYKKEAPFVFTSELAEELIKQDTERFKQEHFSLQVEASNSVRLLELKKISIALNGYETATPLGQKATELEIAIFISMSEQDVLKKIEATLHQHFGVRKIEFSSFALASFSVVRDLHQGGDSFLLVDIGGETTEISMVKKNLLHESISYPQGRNFFIRSAADLLACSLGEAQSCISLFKDGHAGNDARVKIEPIINKLRSEWLSNFQKALADLSNDISVPGSIYLSVDDDLEEFFSETIKSEQFSQHTLTESKFEITPLNTEFFHGLLTFGGDVPRDSFLILETIYITSFFNRIR